MGSHDIARSSDRDIKCLVDLLANFVTPLDTLYLYIVRIIHMCSAQYAYLSHTHTDCPIPAYSYGVYIHVWDNILSHNNYEL